MNNDFSLLIPAYNATFESVNKTFQNIPTNTHILVIDDGSLIPFEEAFWSYKLKYPNMSILRNEHNIGIEESLLIGASLLVDTFDFIARLDIGDSSPAERFEAQRYFLSTNPDYVIVGSWGRFINTEGDELFTMKCPINDESIRKKMYINNMFIHPAVMIRSSALCKVGNYRKKYSACEDYDLFFRLLKVGKAHNIPKIYIDYEVNFSSISSSKRKQQVRNRIKLIVANFDVFNYGFYPYYGLARNVMMLCINRRLSNLMRTFIKW